MTLDDDVEFELLGWPEDGPTLDLDHEAFAYAGKFVTPRTGKAVAHFVSERPDGSDGWTTNEIVGAICFNEDRGVEHALRIRYVTIRSDCRGERIGPRLVAFLRVQARARSYQRVRIAVNNPAAYEALYRAGFEYTGEETGMAELVLEAPPPAGQSAERYREGLVEFADRDLPERQQAVVKRGRARGPPSPVAAPDEI